MVSQFVRTPGPTFGRTFLCGLCMGVFGFGNMLSAEDEVFADPLPFLREWTGRLEFGQTLQSGRVDRNEFTLRAELHREAGRDKYRALAEQVYGKQNGAKSSDRYGANFRWRHTMTDYLYTQTLTSYEVDQIRGIKQRAEQNVGIGYRFLATDRFEASVTPGATAQYNREIGVEAGMNYLATISQEFNWQISEVHRFEEDSTFLFNPENTKDYNYRFNAALIGAVTRSIDLRFRYRFEFENETAPGLTRYEHRVITSLGYSF